MKKKKILAIIPARGGSKGVPGKNIKPILGKPLIGYTIEEARKSKYIDRLVVSTEDKKIAQIAKEFNVEIVERPMELAQDETPINPVLNQVVNFLEKNENYLPDIVLLLQPSSPLRKSKHIDEAIERFLSGNFDSLISIYCLYVYRYEIEQGKYLIPLDKQRRNRQERKPIVIENGAIYLSRIGLIKQELIVGGKIGYYEMDVYSSIDIDEPIDFFITEQLIINEQKNERDNYQK